MLRHANYPLKEKKNPCLYELEYLSIKLNIIVILVDMKKKIENCICY